MSAIGMQGAPAQVWQSADMRRTLVAIPALNEAQTIATVVAEVRRAVPEAQVLVVDDGSRDTTGAVAARAGATVVTLPFNVGVGGAMRTAFLYAQRLDFDAVVQVDADGQHVAEHIPDLVAALDGASVVIGGRFTAGDYQVRGPRKWAMRLLGGALSRVCRAPLTDTTSGFRAVGPSSHRPLRAPLPGRVPRRHGGVAGDRRARRARGARGARAHAPAPGRDRQPLTRAGRPLPGPGGARALRRPGPAPGRAPGAQRPGGGPVSSNWVGLAGAILLLAFVVELLRRGILRERFAALWLAVGLLLGIVALFPQMLGALARTFGFEVPSNLLFFTAILFLLLVAVQLSHEVSRLEARTRRLAEDLALLTAEVRGTDPERQTPLEAPVDRSDDGIR